MNVASHGVAQRFSWQPASLGRRHELLSSSGSSTGTDESLIGAFENLPIQCAYTPEQQCRSHLGDSGCSGPIESNGNINNERFLGK